MSSLQKARQRKRLKHVDGVISVLDVALSEQGMTLKALERAKQEIIPEPQMKAHDKYWVFSRTSKGYRKGAHKVPKWTRIDPRPLEVRNVGPIK